METPIFALLGPAGTGKTYKVQQKLIRNPGWAKLCATTGIAAINLSGGGSEGVMTLASTLKFFDLDSMREAFQTGRLRRTLADLAADYKFLIVDEASMLDAEMFDLLVEALDQVNANVSLDHGEHVLGLILIGDFLQLPPVKGEYCFEGKYWHRVKVDKLTEIKRQTSPMYQKMLEHARRGDGEMVAAFLLDAGRYVAKESFNPEITTIYATNDEVDKWNDLHFRKLCATGAQRQTISASRWGRTRPEWKLIPPELPLAIGAYVMILANDNKEWKYVNGDCGTILGFSFDPITNKVVGVRIKLKRNKTEVHIGKIFRQCLSKETPEGLTVPNVPTLKEFKQEQEQAGVETDDWKGLYETYLIQLSRMARAKRMSPSEPYYDYLEEKWVVGEISYCPLRLAYASTVHKTQGLTLDAVQIVPTHKFFGSPNMFYVALSRCRTLEGLTVVGSPKDVVKRCNTVKKLERWF